MHILCLCFCSFHVYESRYNVNIKIRVCQIIGPAAAAGSAGPVPTPVSTVSCCIGTQTLSIWSHLRRFLATLSLRMRKDGYL